MRALLQRVSDARVAVDGRVVGETGPGLLVFVCAMQGDGEDEARKLASRVARLRIFRDESGRMNRALLDAETPSALVVSQFTLAADTRSGNRPGFSTAAPPEEGRRLYQVFTDCLHNLGIATQTGEFGADMAVTLTNDGPVTIWLDTQS
ncbi:D-tyrosyl-tRNA(Tyr) deacylase [Roseovarius sp. SCSIO 43702]|uniref:D-aminoacyl-tRNA deacylase n=1 Tax=Roseovarius sp. SCSIO 43702 TaxID=2823043 RepID=UPI001C72EF74|nr:D-aminoacyl-tRNA deacylase [Roseovarius sp. SCSIO 43702]QYX56579.1 D-tyrosyl-tRNA(Tyr) deacylase [Roseovarius sp. SCSIO 43702]